MLRRGVLVMAALSVLVLAFGQGTALGADERRFTCRASAIRITGEGPLAFLGTIEPVVANEDEDPCRTDSAEIVGDVALPAGLGGASVLTAETTSSAQGGTARGAIVRSLILTVPGAPVIQARVLTANAEVTCTGPGKPQLSGDSTVTELTIGGQATEVPQGHTEISLGPAGTLHLNETHETITNTKAERSGRRVHQALFLDTDLVDIVVAEAIADYHGTLCKA